MSALQPLPPPHPDPHRPHVFTLPAGSCDAHCHIFGPAGRFPYQASRSYEPVETPLPAYRNMSRRLGFDRAVFVQPAVYGTDHAAMIDALVAGNGRYAGVAIVTEEMSDGELRRLHAHGVRGARFNFVGHLGAAPDPAKVRATADRVAALGWHVVLHVDAAALQRFGAQFADLPCPVMIDHLARLDAMKGVLQPAFRQLLELCHRPNIWVKLAAADRMVPGPGHFPAVLPFIRALAERAPQRLVWGTDWPHPNVRYMPDDGDLVDLFGTAIGAEELRRAILVENPARLYDFTEREMGRDA